MLEDEEVSAPIPTTEGNSYAAESKSLSDTSPHVSPSASLDYETLWSPDLSLPVEDGSQKRTEVWTGILSVLVIAVALLLGVALGWRASSGGGRRGGLQTQASSIGKGSRESTSTQTKTSAAAGEVTPSVPNGVSQKKKGAMASAQPPSGGLQVTQNGKVIYRLSTAEQQAGGTRTSSEPSSDISATRLIHRVEPEYPSEARAQHIQGLVTLDVQIAADGSIHDVAVVEGNPLLGEAAVEAVRQWRYKPYSVDGRPVEMQTRITIRFTLPPA
jgi:TonB family protein